MRRNHWDSSFCCTTASGAFFGVFSALSARSSPQRSFFCGDVVLAFPLFLALLVFLARPFPRRPPGLPPFGPRRFSAPSFWAPCSFAPHFFVSSRLHSWEMFFFSLFIPRSSRSFPAKTLQGNSQEPRLSCGNLGTRAPSLLLLTDFRLCNPAFRRCKAKDRKPRIGPPFFYCTISGQVW